jgi:hypothetical protein
MLLEVSVIIICFLMIMHNRLGIDIRLIWLSAIALIIINHQVGFEQARIEQFNTLQNMHGGKISYEKFGQACMVCDKFGNESVQIEKFYNQLMPFEKFKDMKRHVNSYMN